MRLRTANHNARRIRRRAVYLAAFAFHEKRVVRLTKSGRLEPLEALGVAYTTVQLWCASGDRPADKRLRGEVRARLTGKGLTEEDVRAIRTRAGTYAAIGARYGVSSAMVGHIRNRTRWAHVK